MRHRSVRLSTLVMLGALGLVVGVATQARPLGGDRTVREVAAGERPDDRRLGPLRDLDSHCPLTPPASLEAWQDRASTLPRQLRVALGLWHWPTRTPLSAQI